MRWTPKLRKEIVNTLFAEVDGARLHDAIVDAIDVSYDDDQLREFVSTLPKNVLMIALQWGMNDTVFCDAVHAGFTQGTIKPLGPHTQLQQMIEQLYQEADEMEQDTMVSMVEGTYNEIFANRLRNIAARLELIK